MPVKDGEEMVCHLEKRNAEIGDVFAKVIYFYFKFDQWVECSEWEQFCDSFCLQINVNGNSGSPLYKYLKEKQIAKTGAAIKWNFVKFLVDKEGQPVNRYASSKDPMDIASDIDELL